MSRHADDNSASPTWPASVHPEAPYHLVSQLQWRLLVSADYFGRLCLNASSVTASLVSFDGTAECTQQCAAAAVPGCWCT